MPFRQNGGVPLGAVVMLNGQAPAGGAVVTLRARVRPPSRRRASRACRRRIGLVHDADQPGGRRHARDDHGELAGSERAGDDDLTPQPAPTSITLDPTTSGSRARSAESHHRRRPEGCRRHLFARDLASPTSSPSRARYRSPIRRRRLQHRDVPRERRGRWSRSRCPEAEYVVGDADPRSGSHRAERDRAQPEPVHGHLRHELDGTVTLSGAAPAGGLAVSLAS